MKFFWQMFIIMIELSFMSQSCDPKAKAKVKLSRLLMHKFELSIIIRHNSFAVVAFCAYPSFLLFVK